MMRLRVCMRVVLVAAMAFGLTGSEAVRETLPLDDHWLFQVIDSDEIPVVAGAWEEVTLPHTWNVTDGTQVDKPYRRAVGYYQRRVTIPMAWRGRSVFATIGAANAKATLSLNGTPICEHRTGFTAFTAELTPHLRPGSEQDLQVVVDNRPSSDYPPLVSDYTFFGGIHRRVWLTCTDPVHISLTDYSSPGVYLVQRQVSSARAEVEAQVVLANDLGHAIADAIVTVEVMTPNGTVVTAASSPLQVLGPKASLRLAIPIVLERPRLWNGREDAFCYRARVQVRRGERVTDEVTQPLGLRSFTVDPDHGFQLNGRPYALHGTALHQDHAGKGWAISDADRAVDVGLLTEIGATLVRLVHYPHAPATLDLLDRAGIVTWSEIPIAYRLGQMPAFGTNSRIMLTEMIHQLYNHPSICFWGMFNELSGANPESRTFIKDLHDLAKEIDPTRLTTAATGSIESDPICDITDVIAFNRYFGWYLPGAHLFAPWAESAHRLHPERRIGLSEYGGDGEWDRHADRRDPTPSLFSFDTRTGTEEFQSHLHEEAWRQLAGKPYLWCKVVWNLADWSRGGIRSPSAFPSVGLGRKGLVTNDRLLRKDAFYWYKANWSKEPVLHLCEQRFTPRRYREVDLRVYCNLGDDVAVTINGQPYVDKPQRTGVRLIWPDVLLPVGAVTIQVTCTAGGKVHTDTASWEIPDLLPAATGRPSDKPAPTPNPDF